MLRCRVSIRGRHAIISVSEPAPNGNELSGDGPPTGGSHDNVREGRAGVRCSEGLGATTMMLTHRDSPQLLHDHRPGSCRHDALMLLLQDVAGTPRCPGRGP